MATQLGTKAAREVFVKIADAIAEQDIDQDDRERLAEAVADRLEETRLAAEFQPRRALFVLLASDPLSPCVGYDLHDTGEHVDCPHGRKIRIAMHNSKAPFGRSEAWEQRRPEVRCVTCGAMQFIPEYQDNVLARAEA